MILPPRQHRALTYLAGVSRATAAEATAVLRTGLDAAPALPALIALAAKGLAEADFSARPTSFRITDAGRERLAALEEDGEA